MKVSDVALIYILMISLASCGSQKKTATGANAANPYPSGKPLACAEMIKDRSAPQLDWIVEENSVLDNLTSLAKPSSYRVYSLDSVRTRSFFNAAKMKGAKVSTVIPLSSPAGCQIVSLSESGVMSEKLKEKYPDIVSLKGADAEGKADVRLDYDGSKVKGQVIWNRDVYLLNPVKNGNKMYYMVYRKSETVERKEPFEQNQKGGAQQKFER